MSSAARLLDANANRAREGLRVLEDLARFILDDAELTSELKHLRHALREALELLPIDRGVLLASRSTTTDVGTTIRTDAESRRGGPGDIASAAAGRLTEALRVLAEVSKSLGAADAAARFEQARYRAYTAEQRLVLALGRAGRQWRLCVLITAELCRRPWEQLAELALEAGADCLQLREKALDDAELLRRARRLRDITRAASASLIINDRPDIAILARADGVHLGQSDLSVHEVRALAGFALTVGVSTHTLAQARRAAADGADYCGVGPMFPSSTKSIADIAGPGFLREYLADSAAARVPHLAIGGITPGNIGELAAAGCRGVAVSSAVCAADDPRAACRAILARLPAPALSARDGRG